MGFEMKDAQIQEKSAVIPGIGMHQGVTRWAFKEKVGDRQRTVHDPRRLCGAGDRRDQGCRRPSARRTEGCDPSARPPREEDRKDEGHGRRGPREAGTGRQPPQDQHDQSGRSPYRRSRRSRWAVWCPASDASRSSSGRSLRCKPGQISPVVKNQRGAFLVQLLSVTPFDSTAFTDAA